MALTLKEVRQFVLGLLVEKKLIPPEQGGQVVITVFGANVQEGTSQTYTAQGTYADGTVGDVSNLVTWEAVYKDPPQAAVGTWSGNILTIPLDTVTANTSIIVRATLDTATDSKEFQIINAAPALTGLVITGGSILEGGTQTFRAVAQYSDGSETDVTALATWTFSEGTFNKATGILSVGTNTVENDTRDLKVTATYLTRSSGDRFFTITDTTPPPVVDPGTGTHNSTGNWSDPTVWPSGQVPAAGDEVHILNGMTITYNLSDYTHNNVIWVQKGGSLIFKADQDCTLKMNNRSLIVKGTLRMRPSAAAHVHTLQFININEQNFIGGGMSYATVNASGQENYKTDVGLWQHDEGKLDLAGLARKRWTLAAGSVAAGASTITVNDLTNWQVGDEIMITPTGSVPWGSVTATSRNATSYNSTTKQWTSVLEPLFEIRTVTAINTSTKTVTLNTPLEHPHLSVVSTIANKPTALPWVADKTWTAEVANLTSNVRIGGTASGRTHIFLHSHTTQDIRNVDIQYVGPRKTAPGATISSLVGGRYGLHFHHGYAATKGSLIDSCIIRDCGNRAYVPHQSHGITMSNNIAFKCMEEMFWWDRMDVQLDPNTGQNYKDTNGVDILFPNVSHEIVWERNLLALGFWSTQGFGNVAMLLGMGDRNKANYNHFVGCSEGNEDTDGAAVWAENNEGVWEFKGNVFHTLMSGIWVWQNTQMNHTVEDCEYYNCARSVVHGAYTNMYTYVGGHAFDSPFRLIASATNGQSGATIMRMVFNCPAHSNCVRIHDSPVENLVDANRILECVFRGSTEGAVRLYTKKVDSDATKTAKLVDIVRCDVGSSVVADMAYIDDYTSNSVRYQMKAGSRIRIQPITGQAVQLIVNSDRTITQSNINAFNPSRWGTGKGLTGTYTWIKPDNTEEVIMQRDDDLLHWNEYWRVTATTQKFNPTGVDWQFFEREKVFQAPYWVSGTYFKMRAVWTGFLQAQSTEAYQWKVRSGGAWKITLKDHSTGITTTVFERTTEPFNYQGSEHIAPATYNMVAGRFYEITITHTETSGNRGFGIWWKAASMANWDLLPLLQMYTPDHPDVVLDETPEDPGGENPPPTSGGNALAFPGATGFGRNTRGAYALFKQTGNTADLPDVYFVDNTANSGTGSLRDAVTRSGPRIVIVRTGGTIQLTSQLTIDNPYLTLIGSTAPGGGLAIRGALILIRAGEIIIRNVRIRNGVTGSGDGISFSSGLRKLQNIILDHCSVSWSTDENIGVNGITNGVQDMTIQNCLIAEGFEGHSMGILFNGAASDANRIRNVSVHRNVMVSNMNRNPNFGHGVNGTVINNLVHNWIANCSQFMSDTEGDILYNKYKPGPDTTTDGRNKAIQIMWDGTSPKSRMYIAGCINTNGTLINIFNSGGGTALATSPHYNNTIYGFTPQTNLTTLESDLLPKAGASPRDSVDARLVQEYQNGTGNVPAGPGTYPTLAAGTYPQNNLGIPLTWLVSTGYAANTTAAAALTADYLLNPANGQLGYSILERYVHTIALNGDVNNPFT